MWLPVPQLYAMAWNTDAAPAYAVIGNSFHRHYFLACFTPLFTHHLAIGPLLISPIFCQALILAGLATAVLIAPLRVVGRARQIQMACGAHLLFPYSNLWQPADLKLQHITCYPCIYNARMVDSRWHRSRIFYYRRMLTLP